MSRCSPDVVGKEFYEAVGRVPFGILVVLEISGDLELWFQLQTAACPLAAFSF